MLHNINIYLSFTNVRRKIITIFFLIYHCSVVYSQNSSFHLDSVLYFDEIPVTYSEVSRIVSSKSYGDIFYIAFIRDNNFHLYTYNHSKKLLKKDNFKLNSKLAIGMKPYDFVVTDNDVYVLLDKKIHCLSKAKMKEVYSFYCGRAEYLFLSQEHIIAGFYYNYHPDDSPYKAGLRKFNLQGIQEDSVFLDLPFPEYTHYLPRNLISYNGKKFVFPSFWGLNFLFVDKDFRHIDTLFLAVDKYDSTWVFPSQALSKSIAENMDNLSLYWGLLDNANSSKVSRIEFVEFTDSNNLLVRWFSPNPKRGYSDRFSMNLKNIAGSWKPQEAVSYLETPIPFNTSLNIYAGGMPLLSHNFLTSYSPKHIYQIKIDIPYVESLTYKEYYQRRMEKEKVLDPIISLWVFKYD